jgi:hypothetical protein
MEIPRILVNHGPFPPEDESAEIQAILPLERALQDGKISERQLAQASGKWQANPCEPESESGSQGGSEPS